MLIFFAISIALAGASPVREDMRANNKIVGGAEISPMFKYVRLTPADKPTNRKPLCAVGSHEANNMTSPTLTGTTS